MHRHATPRRARVATLAPCIVNIVYIAAAVSGCTRARPGPLEIRGDVDAFDQRELHAAGARGETLGVRVVDAGGAALALPDLDVHGYGVLNVRVRRPSTALYGGSTGAGDHADELVPDAGAPSYFEIAIPPDAAIGAHRGVLIAAGRAIPVVVDVARAQLPPLAIGAWAEYDPRSLGASMFVPTAAEYACAAMFRARGVQLVPAMPLAAWPLREPLVGDARYVPVDLPDEPAAAAAAVRAWIALLAGTGKTPFAIPIDEPHGQAARERVRAFADVVRAAGGGPGRFLFAVTDEPRAEYGDVIDVYITPRPTRTDAFARWTYNGAPPRAGAMVVDAAPPGLRTWGWIAWRYRIPIWYAWQALYWEDRYNHRGLPPRPLDARADARSFDDGEDRGNLDGVLALPGCHPTLRLAALRRGLEDKALLDAAARCDRAAAEAIAAELVPRALGEASGEAAWPTDDVTWERARRRLLDLAGCSAP